MKLRVRFGQGQLVAMLGFTKLLRKPRIKATVHPVGRIFLRKIFEAVLSPC